MAADRIGDRYLVARRLGAGGMARVYLCWDERLQLWCAIKVMMAQTVADPVLRARFGQEARTLARLVHPHLVRVYDLVHEVETPYMVMEYLPGGTLWHRVKRGGALHPWQAARVIAEVCEGLQAAHDADVVHRDVKPQNLLLDLDGTVKLADFGVARVEQAFRLTLSNMALGTLSYMPPEQQRDAANVDHRADIYSAGATLYALATGRRPTLLMSGDRDEVIQTKLPTVLRDVVARAVASKPADRYATAGEMAAALRPLCRDADEPPNLPLLVDRPTPPPPEPPSDPSLELARGELLGTQTPFDDVDQTQGHLDGVLSTLGEDDPTIQGKLGDEDKWLSIPERLPDLHAEPTADLPQAFGAAPIGDRPGAADTLVLTDPEPSRSRMPWLAVILLLVVSCAGCSGVTLISGLGGLVGAWYAT